LNKFWRRFLGKKKYKLYVFEGKTLGKYVLLGPYNVLSAEGNPKGLEGKNRYVF
jgi:hypothetical protein